MDNLAIILTIVVSTIVILLLVAAVIIVNFMMNKQSVNQRMKDQLLALNFEKELRDVQGEISESIMETLSSELHDNVQHTLTRLRFQLEDLANLHPEHNARFKPAEETLFEASDQLRSLAHRLNNDFILENDLRTMMDLEIQRLKQLKAVEIVWDAGEGYPDLDKNKLIIAFRSFQEFLNNTLKHARATTIMIRLRTNPLVGIEISDNGIGFDITHQKKSGRWNGLRNVEKRAKLAGMSCIIESIPGLGTKYILQDIVTSNAVHPQYES